MTFDFFVYSNMYLKGLYEPFGGRWIHADWIHYPYCLGLSRDVIGVIVYGGIDY